MKHSTRFSDAVHILAFVALYPDAHLTSDKIAASICTNPGFVRQTMSSLRKAGLFVNVKGHPRPSLGREASAITLLDVYRAVDGEKPLLHLDIHTNPNCGVGVNIQLALRDCLDQVQSKVEQELEQITLQEILESCREKTGERQT